MFCSFTYRNLFFHRLLGNMDIIHIDFESYIHTYFDSNVGYITNELITLYFIQEIRAEILFPFFLVLKF